MRWFSCVFAVACLACSSDSPSTGRRRGDVVVEVDRHPVQSVARRNKRLQSGASPVLLLVVRGKATRFVTLGRR